MKRRNASADYEVKVSGKYQYIYINVNIYAPTTAKHHKVDNCRYTQTLCLNILLLLDELYICCAVRQIGNRPMANYIACLVHHAEICTHDQTYQKTHHTHITCGDGLQKGLVNVTHRTHTLICVYLWRCCTWVNNTFKMRKTTNSHTTKVIKSRIY